MRKIISINLRKITALLIAMSMIIPAICVSDVKSDTVIEPMDYSVADSIVDSYELAGEAGEASSDTAATKTGEAGEEILTDSASDSSGITAADKKERNDDAIGDFDGSLSYGHVDGQKLRRYLAAKYSDLIKPPEDNNNDHNNDADNIPELSIEEMNANTDINGNVKHTTIEINGSDFPNLSKNMVLFSQLAQLRGVETVIIDGVDEIRNLYLPATTKHLIIKNTTLNMRTGGILDSSSGAFKDYNLKTFVLDNVTIGNRYETVDSDPEETTTRGYHDEYYYYINGKYVFDLYNCADLEKFFVNVNFASATSTMSFNMGGTYTFDKLTKDNCSINKSGMFGSIAIASNNTDSFFKKNYETVADVEFENSYFRTFLIEKMEADTNWDGFLTQDELDKITVLELNPNSLGTRYADVIHNFNDIKLLRNLESLVIDLENRNAAYIEKIDFPKTGSLKYLSITNCKISCADIEMPGVEDFIYSKNQEYNGAFPKINIDDKWGKVSSVTMDSSALTSIIINNTSGNEGKISIDIYNCINLERVEFQGSGYILKGDASFEGCTNLMYLGTKTATGEWQLDGEFDGNVAALKVTDCANLCSDSKLYVNYNFTGGQRLNVFAYGLDKIKDDKLIINREGTNPGNIFIYCENTSILKTQYTDKGTGYHVKATSGTPNIAVFPVGNMILRKAVSGDRPDSRWVKQWDVVIRLGVNEAGQAVSGSGDQLNNFSNRMTFYVEEEGSIRRVNYTGPRYFLYDPDMIDIGESSHTLTTKKCGRTTVKIYIDKEAYDAKNDNYIGKVNIFIRNIVDKIELENNNPELGSGLKEDDPIYVSRGSGTVSFTSQMHYQGDNLPKNSDGSCPDEVYWMIAERSPSKNNNWEDMLNTYTSYAGISVHSNTWDGYKNTRSYKFSGSGNKYKVVAQVPINKTGNRADGVCIREERYIEVIGPANISIPDSSIVHGSKDKSLATINITEAHNVSINMKDSEKYGDYFEVIKDEDLSDGTSSVWRLKLKEADGEVENIAIRDFILANPSIVLSIFTDGATQEKTINLSSVWVAPKYTISYKLDGGINDSANPSEYTIETATITLKDATKEGYKFLGWYASDEAAEPVTEIAKGTTGNITLTARWEKLEESPSTTPTPTPYPDKEVNSETNNGWGDIADEDKTVIDPTSIKADTVSITGVKDVDYTGTAASFDIRVYYGTDLLREGTDYTVAYKNNINVPKEGASEDALPTVIIKGKGEYAQGKGSKGFSDQKKTFTINPVDISEAEAESPSALTAKDKNGNAKVYYPIPSVMYNGKLLKTNIDYTISYLDAAGNETSAGYSEAGTYNIKLTGIGNYKGQAISVFTLADSETATLMNKVAVSGYKTSAQYTGNAITLAELKKKANSDIKLSVKLTGAKSAIDLTEGEDYTVSYLDNVEVGSATVVFTAKAGNDKNLFGEKRISFKITGTPISKTRIVLKKLESDTKATSAYEYTGAQVTPFVTVTTKGAVQNTLTEGKDYTLEYRKNITVGTATVYIRGINGYTGTVKKAYKIKAVDFAKASVANPESGKADLTATVVETTILKNEQGKYTPEVKVLYKGRLLTEGKDYTLSYKNNSKPADATAGKKAPTVVIKGKGNFTNTISRTFNICVTGDGSN